MPMTEFSAGERILTLNGRGYYKANAGEAYVGCVYDGVWTNPLVVGKTAESVVYRADSGGPFTNQGTVTYKGETYYVSASQHGWGGRLTDTSDWHWDYI